MNRNPIAPSTIPSGSWLPVVLAPLAAIIGLCLDGGTSASEEQVAAMWSADDLDFFERKVRPVLVRSCHECHGAAKQESGLRLDSRAAMLAGAESGPVVVPGKPGESPLLEAIRYQGGIQMPPDAQLAPEEIEALTAWVERGLPWPELDPSPRPLSLADRLAQARQSYWSLQPIARPAIPTVRPSVGNAIDAIVQERLRMAGLESSPPADRWTLIRRATYDLTGLLPSAEEVHAFLEDDSPEAYVRLIDRLLSSPRYGERWGRHWLDVARYADTKGYSFGQERLFPYAYTYRDYVIQAFNEDLPYEQFVTEQLAADLLPPRPGNYHLAALGFLTVGRRYILQEDTLDDRVDVVTRGLLGLTVTCARCHDHKYDPIPTEDYYSLFGVFASCVEPGEPPLLGMPEDSENYRKFQEELERRKKELNDFYDGKYKELTDELRGKAGEYLRLAAAHNDDGPPTPGVTFESFNKDELRPGVLRRWQGLLRERMVVDDPVFGPWARWRETRRTGTELLASGGPAGTPGAVAQHDAGGLARPLYNALVVEALAGRSLESNDDVAVVYAELLTRAYERGRHAADGDREAFLSSLSDDEKQLDALLFAKNSPPTLERRAARRQFDRAASNKVEELEKRVDEHEARSPDAPPRAMALADASEPVRQHVYIRGNPGRPGPEVPRRFLALLEGEERRAFQFGSGRLELAKAIVDPRNPLAPRVIANRLWQHHIGQPLVLSTSDFGQRSDPPSHGDLLDYLASFLLDHGWSIKQLHREIMLSATYCQASHHREECRRVDPENRLLWRAHRRRMEFEPLRDSLLAAVGELDYRIGGKPVDLMTEPFPRRRTVYGLIDRQDLPQLLRDFDFASPDSSSPGRPETSVPQQALFLMNSSFIQRLARTLAYDPAIMAGGSWEQRVNALYERVFARPPDTEERQAAIRFLGDLDLAVSAPEDSAMNLWEQYVQVVLITNEVLYVD